MQVFEDSQVMNEMMSQPVVSSETVDDDELRQELDDLLAAYANSDISSTPVRPPTDNFGKYKCYWQYCRRLRFFRQWYCF